ncbi:hypothetical protein ACWCQE_27530 [Streptomyces sp. NPDC002409]|uniref:hypothetical protein n=1 Tax=Streptomyces misionensis TaxID=67331 RepID=UPI0036BDA9E2
MNGPHHYREAERLARLAERCARGENPSRLPAAMAPTLAQLATAHATLALTAATAMQAPVEGAEPGMSVPEAVAWHRTAGVMPVKKGGDA